jgi:asparagine synthase (glutamine-hydrolysing)
MCGIVGIVKRDGNIAARQDLWRMSATLRHRGPDESGYALLDRGRVGLAHLRLSIIDLAAGQQPMYNEDRSVAIVFNGEIYGHLPLRGDLEARGHRFRTDSDTEVLIHLWEEFGFGFFEHFDGEFAFLLWDQGKHLLLAARDRSGIKPLHYYVSDAEMLFASEIKALYSLDRVPKGFNRGYLWSIGLGLYRPGETLFDGIRSLRPGHYLTVSDGRIGEESPYWRQVYTTDPRIGFAEAKAEIVRILGAAVERRMVADVPVGIYLSSGIDSAMICGLMAREGRDFKAYHLSFGSDAENDEAPLAKRIAAFYGVAFNQVSVGFEELAQGLASTLWHTEMPIWNLHSVAKSRLSRFAHEQGAKVCLTGEGADEGFAGYPYFQLEALRRAAALSSIDHAEYDSLLERFRSAERFTEGILWSEWDRWESLPGCGGLPSYHLTRAARNHALNRRLFARGDQIRIPSVPIAALLESMLAQAQGAESHAMNATRQISREVMHQYIIPTLGDRVELAHSVECRTPFLDREMIEFTGRLPPDYLVDLSDLRGKWILREAGREILPDFLERERKRPFLAPDWHRFAHCEEGIALFENYLSEEALRRSDVFDTDYIRCLYGLWLSAEHRSRNRDLDLLMGMALSVQILDELFLKSRQPSSEDFSMANRGPAPC